MSNSPNSFDALFNQFVFNADENELLDFMTSAQPVGGNVDVSSSTRDFISTPTIEFPLPEIDFPKADALEQPSFNISEQEQQEQAPPLVLVKQEVAVPDDLGTVKQEEVEEEKMDENNDSDWTPEVVKPRKPSSRKRKRNSEYDDTPRETPSAGKRHKKLYELKPFNDPVKERNRLNAINAKLNRDRKKKERDALMKQMDLLREENEKLRNQLRAKDKILKRHGLLK